MYKVLLNKSFYDLQNIACIVENQTSVTGDGYGLSIGVSVNA